MNICISHSGKYLAVSLACKRIEIFESLIFLIGLPDPRPLVVLDPSEGNAAARAMDSLYSVKWNRSEDNEGLLLVLSEGRLKLYDVSATKDAVGSSDGIDTTAIEWSDDGRLFLVAKARSNEIAVFNDKFEKIYAIPLLDEWFKAADYTIHHLGKYTQIDV